MREVYSNITKVMIDARNNTSLMQLPLDKLLQQAAASPASGAAAPAAAAEAAAQAGAVDARSRDNQRGRDRDGR
jgi:membrane protease subunit HflK